MTDRYNDPVFLRSFQEYKEKHPDYFPDDTPIEKQYAVFSVFLDKQNRAKQEKSELFQKLDQAVGGKQTKDTSPDTPEDLGLPEMTPEEVEASKRVFKENIPDNLPVLPGIWQDWMDFSSAMSYAYNPYHFGTFLAAISMIIGRKAVMYSTAGTVFCNVYVMNIGITSLSGKTTARNHMRYELLSTIMRKNQIQELPKKNTPEGFLQRLSENPFRIWDYNECGEFFSDTKILNRESLVPMLCDAYDGNDMGYGLSRGEKGKKSDYFVKNPFLTILWNTTDSEIERQIIYKHYASGFILRCMWFWCMTPAVPRKNRARTLDR